MPKTSETLDFEATLVELEKVVTELDGEVKLERALTLFDRGMQLSHHCEAFLRAAEQKVEVLKKSHEGSLFLERFEPEEIAE